jgi:hypothetical protein
VKGAPGSRPGRVVVAHPRTLAARRGRPVRPATTDLSEQTGLGDVLLRGLVRAQLALALRMSAALVCVLGGVPLLFAVAPGVREWRVLGLDLPWLLLGVVVYPLLVAGGWIYLRLAERNEREFHELVDRS